jgi:hypothetical protein
MRLKTLLIFGAGYVWGARAGRDPYVELVDRVRGFLDSDLARDYLSKARTVQPADDATDEQAWDEEADDEEAEPWDEEADDEEAELWDEGTDDDAELSEPNNGEEAEPAEEPARSRASTRRRASSRQRG